MRERKRNKPPLFVPFSFFFFFLFNLSYFFAYPLQYLLVSEAQEVIRSFLLNQNIYPNMHKAIIQTKINTKKSIKKMSAKKKDKPPQQNIIIQCQTMHSS